MAGTTHERHHRRPVSSAATRVRPRTPLMHYPIARGGEGVLSLLRVPLAAGEALVVFSSRKTARAALGSMNLPENSDARVCSGGELVSLLFGPYKDVGWVVFDPLPGRVAEEIAAAGLVSRERFVDYLLGRSMLRARG